MHTISVRESLRFGWETFKKRPLFFIGVVVAVIVVTSILTSVTPENPRAAFPVLLTIAVLALNMLIEMGLVAFAIKAHDDVEKVTLHDLWHPQAFLKYVGVKILTGIIVILGLILLVVPGVIAALALMFATYLVIERNLGPVDALKESVRITKGNRWKLFLLALAMLALNILGAIALLVGLLITIPVSLLALAHVYRTLAGKAGSSVSV